jgi:hypothetical protein
MRDRADRERLYDPEYNYPIIHQPHHSPTASIRTCGVAVTGSPLIFMATETPSPQKTTTLCHCRLLPQSGTGARATTGEGGTGYCSVCTTRLATVVVDVDDPAFRPVAWAISWVLFAVGSPVPMSRNCRMPSVPAR